MADTTLNGKYFVKKQENDAWQDIATMFAGTRILSIEGFGEQGDSVNVYNEQWVTSQREDFLIASSDGEIVRKNVDLSITLIVSSRYSESQIDERGVYNRILRTLLNKDFYIKSTYNNMSAHVVCLKSFKPTTMNLERGNKNYILVTIPLHCLDDVTPTTHYIIIAPNEYAGFATLSQTSAASGNLIYIRPDLNHNMLTATTSPTTDLTWATVQQRRVGKFTMPDKDVIVTLSMPT